MNSKKISLAIPLLVEIVLHGAAQQDALRYVRGGNYGKTQQVLENFSGHLDKNQLLLEASRHVHADQPKIVQLLIDRKADVHCCDQSGNTPLLVAFSLPRINKQATDKLPHAKKDGQLLEIRKQVVRTLIDRKANVQVANKQGETPMMLAVQGWADLDGVKLLVSQGATGKVQDNKGRSTLMFAVNKREQYRDPMITDYLIEQFNMLDIPDKQQSTPLMHAIAGLDVVSFELLLRKGVDLQPAVDVRKVYRDLKQEGIEWSHDREIVSTETKKQKEREECEQQQKQERLKALQELVDTHKKAVCVLVASFTSLLPAVQQILTDYLFFYKNSEENNTSTT